jgi:cell division protein FtsB
MERQGIIETQPPQAGEPPPRAPLAARTLFWAAMVICGALLVSTLSEAWTRTNVDAQVTAARARNAALRQDVANTQRAIQQAQSPVTIEREARSWGYARPGDHPVLVVPSR